MSSATTNKSLLWNASTSKWTNSNGTAVTAATATATAITITATGKIDGSRSTDTAFALTALSSSVQATLLGGVGNDTLTAVSSAKVWLNGGIGNDTLTGATGSDTFELTGNFGVDTLVNVAAGTAVDTIKIGTSFANLSFAAFNSGSKQLSVSVADMGDALIQFASTTVADQKHAKFITTDKTFYVQTTATAATLESQYSTDAEYIRQFGSVTTTFTGGKNDTLIGGTGNDVFIYNKDIAVINGGGSGTDTVYLTTGTNTTQTIDLTNSKFTSIEAVAVSSNIAVGQVLRGLTTADSIKGGVKGDSIWTRGGNDTITGGTGIDTFWFATGDGVDLITDLNTTDKDVLKFVGVNQADISYNYTSATAATLLVTYGSSGSDIVMIENAQEKLFSVQTADKTFGVLTAANAYSGVTTLAGTANAEYIRNIYDATAGTTATITFNGAGGADTLIGGSGKDSFVYTSALAYVDGNLGNDVLGVTDATLSAVTIDLYNNATKFLNIESVKGGSGADVLRGYSAAAETLDGGAGNDALWSAGGNDSLFGGAGNDTYWFAAGDGADSLIATEDKDVYKFVGVNFADLTFSRNTDSVNILQVAYGSDSLTINSFTSATSMKNNVFQTNDNTFHVITDQSTGNLNGTTGKDLVKMFNDTGLQIDSKGGADTIYGGGGDDVIAYYADLASVDGGAGTNTLSGNINSTYSPLTIDLQLSKYTNIQKVEGGNGNDILRGTAGAQTLTGGVGSDALWGAAGDDLLKGGAGVDTYWFTAGDGTDTIAVADNTADDALDVVKFYSVAGTTNVTATLDGSDLNLTLTDGSKLVLQSWSGTSKINKFTFDSGTYKLSDDAATWTKL